MEYDQGEFSHVGMLFWDKNEWYVVHETPAEISGKISGVVIDPLSFYIDPKRSKRFAFYDSKR